MILSIGPRVRPACPSGASANCRHCLPTILARSDSHLQPSLSACAEVERAISLECRAMGRFQARLFSGTLGCLLVVAPPLPDLARSQAPAIELRYPYGPDSFRQEGAPQGTVTTHIWNESKIFPGTIRRYYVYVPQQYEAARPAALMVFQDGHAYLDEHGDFRVPIVFANLIHKGELPVPIGVFVDPGHKQAELPPEPGWRPEPAN